MRRISLAFAAGFTVATCCVLWIIQRSRNRQTEILPGETPQPAPAAPSAPAPSPINDAPQPSVYVEGERKPSYVIPLVIAIILGLVGLWFYSSLSPNPFSLPPVPKMPRQARTIPIVPDSNSSQGASTLPTGYLIDSASAQAHATLSFYINQIKDDSPTTATLSGIFHLAVPSALQATICDETKVPSVLSGSGCPGKGSIATRQSISICQFSPEGQFETVQRPVYLLKSQYSSMALTLTVGSDSGPSAASPLFSTTLPLGAIFPTANTSLLTQPGVCGSAGFAPPDPVEVTLASTVALPLVGQGQEYPDDWYAQSVAALITLPPSLYIPDKLAGGGGVIAYLPMDLRVAASTNMSGYTIQIVPGTTGTIFESPPLALGENLLALLATRSSSSRNFTYAITAIIPLVFFFVFLWILFLPKRKGEEPLSTTLFNFLIEVLAVLALRQILVPTDIQGEATRLDIWFGLWAMAPLLLFIIKPISQAIRERRQARRP